MAQLMWFAPYKKADVTTAKELGVPTPEFAPVLTNMHSWMTAILKGDQMMPFTFQEMGATAPVARLLMGEKVWTTVFSKDDVKDTDVCSCQLRLAVFEQLTALANHLTVSKSHHDEAKRRISEASAAWASKKSRGSPYGS